MSRSWPAVLLLMFLVTACGRDKAADVPSSNPLAETTDLMGAVNLALPAFFQTREPLVPYKLVGAEQMILDGKTIWRITFKPTHLLPADSASDLVGLGGEVFVNVDLKTGKTTIRGGE